MCSSSRRRTSFKLGEPHHDSEWVLGLQLGLGLYGDRDERGKGANGGDGDDVVGGDDGTRGAISTPPAMTGAVNTTVMDSATHREGGGCGGCRS